ncbi:hypothetical protein ACIRON_05250 [Nocardioides sp. NPDC101246]|uniref:hypothetical protein n=1 Tax=Nocardioides sp. NPDC101246 TaxID=3364336 RepID=UPI0037F78960
MREDHSAPATTQSARMLRLGLYGVLTTYAALVLLGLLGQPVFAPDEPGHVHYGIALTQGRIPVIGETSAGQFPEISDADMLQIQSFHPPLYYLITGPIERIALETGLGYPLLLLTRLLNLALSALTVFMVGRIAWLLTSGTSQRRATIALAAAAVVGTVPALLIASGRVMNDSLAVALATGTLLVLVRSARAGLRLREVALIAALCTLGMLTRISFLPIWLLAIGAVAALSLWPGLRFGPPRTPWRTALGRASAVLAAPVAGAGWFYVLNVQRYGDITGGSGGKNLPVAADRTLDPAAADGPLLYLLDPASWWEQMQQYAGVNASSVREPLPLLNHVLIVAVVTLLLLGVLIRLFRWVDGGRPATDAVGSWCLVALALVAVATCLEMATHVTHKGWPNARYLLNGVAVWGIAAAGLAHTFGRRLAPYAVLLISFTGVLGYLTFLVTTLRWNEQLESLSWFDTIAGGMNMSGFPVPHVLTAILLVAVIAGLGLQARALIGLSRAEAAVATGRHAQGRPSRPAATEPHLPEPRLAPDAVQARIVRRTAATTHRRGDHPHD